MGGDFILVRRNKEHFRVTPLVGGAQCRLPQGDFFDVTPALLLDTLAHQLQHHPLSFTLDWVSIQLDYEKTHNAYAYRLLTSVKAHLTREQKYFLECA